MEHEASVRGVGFSVMGAGHRVPVAYLQAGDRVALVHTSRRQARAIVRARQGRRADRPRTTELFADVVAELGGAVDAVRVDAVNDGACRATVQVDQYRGVERRRFAVHALAGDAIALAVRVGCPVTVSERVLEQIGQALDGVDVDALGTWPDDDRWA